MLLYIENQQCYYTIRHLCSAIANYYHLSRLQYDRSYNLRECMLLIVLQSCGEKKRRQRKKKKRRKKKKKKDVRTFSWSQSNATVAYMYTHISHLGTKAACNTRVHARGDENPPRRELHYILLDCINSVDARACSRDILHAHVRYVGRTNFMCVGCTVACVRRARDPRARTLTRREILWRCNQGGYVFITEYRYY